MRVIPVGVLALSLVICPVGAISEEGKDEIDFNQDPIVTVDIDPNNVTAANNRNSYIGYVSLVLVGAYALASWKVSWVRSFNTLLWNKINPFTAPTKSAL